MKGKATEITKNYKVTSTGAVQRHFLLEPPISAYVWDDENAPKYDYVVVSALPSAFDHGGSETFIFGADETAAVLDWGELDGSQRGTIDHEAALADAGYVIFPADVELS